MTTENNFNYGSGSSQINRCGTDDRAAVSNPEPRLRTLAGEQEDFLLMSETVLYNKIHSINNKKKQGQHMKTAEILRRTE